MRTSPGQGEVLHLEDGGPFPVMSSILSGDPRASGEIPIELGDSRFLSKYSLE